MVWIKWLVIVPAALSALGVALGVLGASRWAARTRALIGRLEAARSAIAPDRYDAARELEGLPAPVQRFFRAVLEDGQPMIAALDIEHTGTFNLAAEGPDQWKPFTSKQRTTTRRPGFVWDGRVVMLPGVAVHVHDAYIAGEGILHPAVMGLVSLTDIRGASPEPGGVAHGELLRWFAEAAWYPTALLPSQGVRWSAVDEPSARATVGDGVVSGALLFRFDPQSGVIASVRAEVRGRIVGNDVMMTPWEGRWFDYAEHEGVRTPTRGEVSWMTPQGPRPYWRGSIRGRRYEYAK